MALQLPNLERNGAFRVFGSEADAGEGSFTGVVIQGTGGREEITFGDYHAVNVFTDKVGYERRPSRIFSSYCACTIPILFTPLHARYTLPSFVAAMLRMTPPPEGTGVVENDFV
jgi:hypothetical protein